MQLPERLGERLLRVRASMNPPPHSVKVGNKRYSYCNLKTREVFLSIDDLNRLEWIYRHEIMHLDKWPRKISRELYWATKIANRLRRDEREFFTRRRNLILNISEDAVIDYYLGRRYGDARRFIANYVECLNENILADPPPHEEARMIISGLRDNLHLRELLEKSDIVEIGVIATRWLMEHEKYTQKVELIGEATDRDYVEAAGELIAEGEDIKPLYDFASDDGVEVDMEKASMYALVRAYDWYISRSKFRKLNRASRSRQTIWSPGDDQSKLDLLSSLTVFPTLIPGLTTLKREPRDVDGFEEPIGYMDVAILVDESGSMRDKVNAVRRVGVSLIAYMNKKRVQYQIIGFGATSHVRVPLGFDYIGGVRYFAEAYRGWQGNTLIKPALEKLSGRRLLVYVLSDAMIHDLDEVDAYESKISEVVLVLINSSRSYGEFVKAFGRVPVRGYHVPQDKTDVFIVKELGRLA